MRKIIFFIFSLFLVFSLIGAECDVTLPQGILPTPTPTFTHTPTPTPTPIPDMPTPEPTPSGIFRVVSYTDPSGNDPVADGYINAQEKATGFVVRGEAPEGSTVEAKLVYKQFPDIPLGTITVGTSGWWEVNVPSSKWLQDGYYEFVFTNTTLEETITKGVLLDTVPPSITSSSGYAQSIRDYGLTITQEAEHIECLVSSVKRLITSSWKVYVKVGSAIVISQNGVHLESVEFQDGEYTKITSIPGILIKVDNSIPHDETLEFDTEAPTWGDGFFNLGFSEEVKTSSIPLQSAQGLTDTQGASECLITLQNYTSTVGILYVVSGAEAVFPVPGTDATASVKYVISSSGLIDKVGWQYYIHMRNLEDLAGNKADVETNGILQEYALWLH